MRVVVTVMDRTGWESNTDVVVVVDTARRRLTWVPRDAWCPRLADRVNQAYRLGGHPLLARALGDLGLAVAGGLCVSRDACERVLGTASVVVPVSEPMRFWYPLTPTTRVQDGRRAVDFDPPEERLHGVRLHEWVGARYRRDRAGSDLDRLVRQAVLLRRLLETGFDFRAVLDDAAGVRVWGPDTLRALANVRAGWRMQVLDGFEPRTIDGKKVLRRLPGWRRAGRRVLGRVRPRP